MKGLRSFAGRGTSVAIIIGMIGAADAQDGVPLRLPPGARLDVGVLRFDVQPLSLDVQTLDLPQGFGVPLATGSSPSAAPNEPPTTQSGTAAPSRPVFIPAEPGPPDRLPLGASFGSQVVSLASSPISPGQVSDIALGAAGGAFGGGSRDLPGMSVREEAGGLRFTLGADVLFDFDKSHLRPEADGILRRLVEEVRKQVPRARYLVEGHTDAKGSDAYNDRLSNRRADAVRDWLVRRGGVSSGTINTAGYGERRPVAPNEHPDGSDDPEGRQLNRRVEVLVTPLP